MGVFNIGAGDLILGGVDHFASPQNQSFLEISNALNTGQLEGLWFCENRGFGIPSTELM